MKAGDTMIAVVREDKQIQISELIREAKEALEVCERSEGVPFAALVLSKALCAAAQRAEHIAGIYVMSAKDRMECG